jgi:hypothetical protein
MLRVPHRRTGFPRGARPGNTQTLKHGMKAASTLARRKTVNKLLREARKLIREAEIGRTPQGPSDRDR